MNSLPTIVRLSGPWGFALVVLACVVLFLTAKAVWGGLKGMAPWPWPPRRTQSSSGEAWRL